MKNQPAHNSLTLIVSILLVLSGAASLLYQVTWVRLLGLSLGSTSASVATVVSSFFLGLAIGSYLTERMTRNSNGSFGPYVIVEAAIGAFGLLSIPLFLNLDVLMAHAPAFGSAIALKFAVSVVLLVIPTTCMGATFPIMASILVRRQNELGLRISQLYGFNTFGAVLGAALSGFVLIPAIALDGTILLAAALNIIVAGIAAVLWIKVDLPPIEQTKKAKSSPAGTDSTFNTQMNLAAVVLVATGFGSIAIQIGWTKYLAIFTGSTIYGFSAILSIFLFGITLGSLAFQGLINRVRSPAAFMPMALIALGATMLIARYGLGQLPALQALLNRADVSGTSASIIKYGAVGLSIMPATVVLGALFPLNLKAYCGELQGVRERIGKAYAINTLAGIGGALFAGFVAIPIFGTDALLLGIALATVTLAAIWLPFVTNKIHQSALAVVVVAICLTGAVSGGIDYKTMIGNVGYDSSSYKGKTPQFLFLEEGKAGVISLTAYENEDIRLQNNGLNESSYRPGDANHTLLAEAFLSLVPHTLHTNPKSAFIVGFGGGHTTRMLSYTDIESIKVVELEPAVVNAGKTFGGFVTEVLADPKIDLEFNDARNSLLVGKAKYDLIISQPSHPWVAGAANVFTQQFWEIGRSRLNHGGIFAQWVNLFSMNTSTLKSLLNTFYSVYDEGFLISEVDNGNLILIGSMEKLTFDFDRMDSTLATEKVAPIMGELGIERANDILWYYSMSRQSAVKAAADAPLNLDTNLLSEIQLSSYLNNEPSEDPYRFLDKYQRLDITGFLNATPKTNLIDLGNYFLYWEHPSKAAEVAELLERHDKTAAKKLRYLSLHKALKYKAAFDYFEQYSDWDDDVVEKNIAALSKLGFYDEAEPLAEKVSDSWIANTLKAQILYRQQRIEDVLRMNPLQMSTNVWYLLALARSDLEKAADHLTNHNDIPEAAKTDVLQVLLRNAASKDRAPEYRQYSKRLVKQLSEDIEDLLKIGERASRYGNSRIVEAVKDRIAKLDPQSPAIKTIASWENQ